MKLKDVDRETILRAAHAEMRTMRKMRTPRWAWITRVCCVGSTSAHDICEDLNWAPDISAHLPLPPRGHYG